MRTFKDIRLGSLGTDVIVLQSFLRALQFVGEDGKAIDIDGECGVNTVFAINAFQSQQRAYGYECGNRGRNDGVFGQKCWSRLLGV